MKTFYNLGARLNRRYGAAYFGPVIVNEGIST